MKGIDNMKCAVVQDLLPIYCDGVCSPETSVEIEKHTENCPVCSSLLKDYKSEVKPAGNENSFPRKPFRKIKAKIFRSKLVIILLALVLIAFVSAVGYLAHGQVVKEYGHPSFETIISSFGTKRLMEKLCEGDIDYVVNKLSVKNNRFTYYNASSDVQKNFRKALEDYYNVIKDKNTEVELKRCDHGEFNDGSMSMLSNFVVRTEGLPDVAFDVNDVGGYYEIYCYLYSGKFGPLPDRTSDFYKFISEINFNLNPAPPDINFEKNALNWDRLRNGEEDTRDFGTVWGFITNYYSDSEYDSEEYSSALAERMGEINKAGIYCDDFTKTNFRFDSENMCFLIDIYAVFTDPETQNKIAYIRTVQVRDYYKYVVLDEFQPTIIDGGVSEKTREMIENMF